MVLIPKQNKQMQNGSINILSKFYNVIRDIKIKDNRGLTALEIAEQAGHEDVTQLLRVANGNSLKK